MSENHRKELLAFGFALQAILQLMPGAIAAAVLLGFALSLVWLFLL
ncbi:hypothetical protein [Hyphomicrobium sp.]|nr:hypothetical protein [Hyphomicrobium sp.]MBY0561519.1 hypothetical protein [Hyphomicrobium sp.]